jgi:hypothetical protein
MPAIRDDVYLATVRLLDLLDALNIEEVWDEDEDPMLVEPFLDRCYE